MKRIKPDELFIETAKLFSKRSTCLRKQVGCVIVKDGRIISTGYNGTMSNQQHCSEYFAKYFLQDEYRNADTFEQWINSEEFYNLHRDFSIFENHAEVNCIAFAVKNGININNSIAYVTLSPCLDCAKLIISSGIKKVIYLEKYDRDDRGINYLIKNDVECVQFLNIS